MKDKQAQIEACIRDPDVGMPSDFWLKLLRAWSDRVPVELLLLSEDAYEREIGRGIYEMANQGKKP